MSEPRVKTLHTRGFKIVCGIGLLLLFAAFGWYGLQIRQKQRDEGLIAALKYMHADANAAIRLLNEGANPNATDAVPNDRGFPQSVVDKLRGTGMSRPTNTKLIPMRSAQPDATPALILAVQGFNVYDPQGKRADGLTVVHALLKHGANVNAVDPAGDTALLHAVNNSNVALVRLLLEYHADPNIHNQRGDVPLLRSLQHEIARLLLEHGANVNVKNGIGETPLHFSVMGRDTDLIRIELEKGADVNARDSEGRTPLMLGSTVFSPATMRLLLDHGAKINAQDSNGSSALMHAAAGMEPPGEIQLLLTRGANPKLKDKQGRTALDAARSARNADAVPLLQAAMKR